MSVFDHESEFNSPTLNKWIREQRKESIRGCRFYGACGFDNVKLLLDQEGNQCGAIASAYAPCQMEIQNQKPDLKVCPLRESPVARRRAEYLRISR